MAADTWSALMQSLGFKMYSTCTCGGILKHKYRKGAGDEVWVLPNRNQYQRISGGKRVKQGPIEELETVLSI